MTPESILDTLKMLGAHMEVVGDKLRCRAPVGVLTPELRQTLAEHKATLLRLLSTPDDHARTPAPVSDTSGTDMAEPPAPAPELIDAAYQRIWFDYALRDGTYTSEELRQARKVVKPWGPVRTYRLVAATQYSEPLGRWLLVIIKAEGDVPPDARVLTPVAGGKALAWLTAAQLPQHTRGPGGGRQTPHRVTQVTQKNLPRLTTPNPTRRCSVVTDLLEQCQALGVTLAPDDNGALRISPPGVLPNELKAALRTHKPEVLKVVTAPEPDCLAETLCHVCGSRERWRWLDGRALCRVCLVLDLAPLTLVRQGWPDHQRRRHRG